MLPPPPGFDADRAAAEVRWLVEEVGPRPVGSEAAHRAAAGVARRLRAAGWEPAVVGMPDNLVACRGRGTRLLLAHTDTVPGSPGAVDDAAGVAVLLELARRSAAEDLCLGFPAGEEAGLLGSRRLAASAGWRPDGAPLELVVATELLGQGTLAVMGLGPDWGTARLRWLVDRAPVSAPWVYRAYSRALPGMERSDHLPFARAGVPAILLLGRGEHGVFPRYHQPADTAVDPARLAEAAGVLESLATGPAPPPASRDPAVILGHLVLPGALTRLALGAAALSAWADRRRLRELPGQLAVGLGAALAAALAAAGWAESGVFGVAEAEATAAATAGLPATGWWRAAPLAALTAALAFLGARRLLGPRGSAPLAGGLLALTVAAWEPVAALPLAVGALLSRLHPLLALVGPAWLLRPDAWRELSFHGLLPPLAWGALWALAIPAVGARPRPSPVATAGIPDGAPVDPAGGRPVSGEP